MKENVIKLHDKKFKVMIPAAKIEEAVAAVAAKINEDYREKRNPLFLGVLNGSFMFMSDLLKKIDFNCEISFVKLSSYCGTSSSGDVKCLIGLGNNIEGRDVIIVEDIVDTGASIEHMVEELKTKKPASIRVCTLFFKPKAYHRLSGHAHRQRVYRGIRAGLRPVGPELQGCLRGDRIVR